MACKSLALSISKNQPRATRLTTSGICPRLAPTLDLLSVAMESYSVASGRSLDRRRVFAWHVLTDLGDALWRTEQGVEVVDGPLARRFDDLLVRLAAAGVE